VRRNTTEHTSCRAAALADNILKRVPAAVVEGEQCQGRQYAVPGWWEQCLSR